MTKVLVTEQHLADIAQAIRDRLGSEDTYRPGDMPAAIRTLYPEPAGSVSITQNGTVNVKDYAAAAVNVQPNLQARTATVNGDVYPDAEHDGLSKVTVAVPGVSYAGYAQWQAMPPNHIAGIMRDGHLYRSVATGEPDAYPDELDILPMRATVQNNRSGGGGNYYYTADGFLVADRDANVASNLLVQINPNIYGKLLFDMAGDGDKGQYNLSTIRLCTNPALTGYYEGNSGSGALKAISLIAYNRSEAAIREACVNAGVTATITNRYTLNRQIVEWDISDLTDPFYLCFHRCHNWTRFYSIKAVKVNAEEGGDE